MPLLSIPLTCPSQTYVLTGKQYVQIQKKKLQQVLPHNIEEFNCIQPHQK